MLKLTKIPAPEIVETLSYKEILEQKKEIIKSIKPDWEELESADFAVILEAWAYDDILHRQRFNNAIKAMLLPYSQGTDLDNLAVMYGVERLPGTKPAAEYSFFSSNPLEVNYIIPKGTLLTSEDMKHLGSVCEDITILAGDTQARGFVELDDYLKSSDIKTEIFVNPLFFIQAKAVESFKNGSEIEKDDDFRERILLSLYASSTAGSKESYIYWARSADTRIKDVAALSTSPGVVDVYILADSDDFDDEDDYQRLIEKCEKSCCDEKRRPLTDQVNFYFANIIESFVNAEITLSDLSMQEQIRQIHEKEIKERYFELGEKLSLSWIYSILHSDGVEDVKITEPMQNIEPAANKAVKITAITLTYS